MPYTAVHLNITIVNSYFRKQNSFRCTCVWYTTKENGEIEPKSGLFQHKFLVFIKLFHWNILSHFKDNMCQ